MRGVINRVRSAKVVVDDQCVAEIGKGVLVLLGVHVDDTDADARWLAQKIAHLRLFEDSEGKLNRSTAEVGGSFLVVSNFTLYGDCRKGRRPSFTESAPFERGRELYERFCDYLRAEGVPVQTGVYGAHMVVSLENDGPVTLIVDSPSPATETRSG
ncbi:MAG: D-aminoacyl-tRNA deacylase [Fimbriimonadales bacterium]|jgi:D-tyrosyl-tRNA(Tyr) deacylase|nr:D-tyrosyl-tRNA(Tyr) deacylase [Armatimonadota bacterium]MCX7687466.1 D-aminoacyl-tRNA deacylase [Fimbriimonadales bacterium]CUU11211.1 D-tyrosyl-tRNA(Tyr) deacylase [Armatimonadetes bacterium GBS]CUU35084.1 D-tyrosyl-tRNA(Tyr) deacylase [Armatimonadetes bacterium GXS]CUU37148.1 D-tyrosyl-tRNA(Tyr) deacylase [Armatimonadetes bacterium DC]GBC90505.1 D-aminoacyl-tRNA deacylase [bacterium HR14]